MMLVIIAVSLLHDKPISISQIGVKHRIEAKTCKLSLAINDIKGEAKTVTSKDRHFNLMRKYLTFLSVT